MNLDRKGWVEKFGGPGAETAQQSFTIIRHMQRDNRQSASEGTNGLDQFRRLLQVGRYIDQQRLRTRLSQVSLEG